VEKNRSFEGLALEELEAQTLDLLPDREEMMYVPSYNKLNNLSFNKVDQTNIAKQDAWAHADKHSIAVAANGAEQINASNIGDSK
jgi:hypothetical protein